MIHHLFVDEAAGLNQPVGQVFVFCRWLEVAAGVVVNQNHLDGEFERRKLKDFTRVDNRLIDAAQTDQFDIEDSEIIGQTNSPEVLLIATDFVLTQQDLAHDAKDLISPRHLDLLLFA